MLHERCSMWLANTMRLVFNKNLTCESFMMLVTSGWIRFAMPKSINFSVAFTMTKFAGFKSLWTIPAYGTQHIHCWFIISVINKVILACELASHCDNQWWKENHVCGSYGQPPAFASSRTSCPVSSQSCGFATRCWGPNFHTPSACRCSCLLFHCKHTIHAVIISTFRTEIKSKPSETTLRIHEWAC